MSKRKQKEYENPGFDSTIYVFPQQIADTANAFREIAISLSKGHLDAHDVKRNVIYTNAAFAIELYFKSFLVKRVSAPFDCVVENGEVFQAEFDDENRVTVWHSRLVVPEEYQKHNLQLLFNALSDELKERVMQEVLQVSTSIKTPADLLEFFNVVKNYFVDKRYEFQDFIFGVPKNSHVIYVLIPVLNAIGKALATPPDVPITEFM
ncbi:MULTISPECIES: hypothetical protein [Enterobacteriaceae]|uniref:hypothetical protein n=1 Tax=Enterobacteriaceae TaxID=543 RepID=UPI00070A9159|nr:MULTISPECIES: hypothetical protein [Enterobacteriaceae]EJC8215847.1 hypothetical protein [Citrobacter freundii]MDF5766221.1 hypothetical protein [Citrobacter freundii]OUC38982.1 hypothetical protein BJP35_0616 [Enterobacter sp. J49]